MGNPLIEMTRPEKYPHDKNRETREKNKPKQYLTRFGNLLMSSGQERDFIDSTVNYNLFLTSRNFQRRFSVGYNS